jgi:hypothetical protein
MSALPKAVRPPRLSGWTLLWLVPVAALALLVGWETDWGRQIVRVPSAPRPVEPKPIVASALPDYQIEGGLAAHSETVQRTLFNATRRPAPALAADDGPRQIVHGAFQLMGTTVTGDHNVAFLKEVGNGKTRVVRQGDEINGMKVALVTPDRVKFTAGDDSEDLILKVAPGPKTTLVAAPPPPGGRPTSATAAAAARNGQVTRALPPNLNPAQAQALQQQQNARAARRAARQGSQESQGQGQTTGSGMGQGRAGRNR